MITFIRPVEIGVNQKSVLAVSDSSPFLAHFRIGHRFIIFPQI